MRLLFQYLTFTSCILLCSCTGKRYAYVSEGFEPVFVAKKGDVSVSGSFRSISQVKTNIDVAFKDNNSIRAGYSGYFGQDNFDLAYVFTSAFKKNYMYAAALYNYQSNVRQKNSQFGTGIPGYLYKFNCRYHSLALLCGVDLSSKHTQHQFYLKGTYNVVQKYNVFFVSNNGDNSYSRLSESEHEDLHYNIKNFLSAELSYSFLWSMNKIKKIKIQAAYLYCQKTLAHTHYFYQLPYSAESGTVERTTMHPLSHPFYLSIGFVLLIPKGEYHFKQWIKELRS